MVKLAKLMLFVAIVLGASSIGLPAAAGQSSPAPTACAVTGTVADAAGLALPGAMVRLSTGGDETVTTEHGGYCLRRALPGPASVVVTLSGFRTASIEVTVDAGIPLTVDVALAPAAFRDDVVVTATRTSRRLEDVPVRTEVVNTDAMRVVAARTLADAVEYTTGVRVESNCQNCNFAQIRLLGLEGPYTQILMDGQPVISSLAQVYGIEQIPSRMIERIEIVKGGGSALYGSGAVGGVVNVIPREPAAAGALVESRVDFVGGRASQSHSGSADWASGDLGTNATAFFQIDRVTPLDVSGDGFTEVSRRRLGTGGMRASRRLLDGRARFTTEATLLDEDRRGGDRLDLPPAEAQIAEWIDSRRLGASATWIHGVSSSFDYRVTAAVADMRRDSYYGTGQDPDAFGHTESLLLLVDGQINQYRGRHIVSWGGQLSTETLADEQPAYGRRTAVRYTNAGLFVQDDWSFAPGWQLITGLRADHHSAVDRVIVSPRLALMASPRESLDIRVSVARGFRAPQVFDEDLHLSSVAGEVRYIQIDPSLREETSTNYMIGAEWKPEAGIGQALLEANVFATRLNDLFLARADDDPLTAAVEFLKVNHGRAMVSGVELNAGWGVGEELVVQGGVVLQRARHDEAEPDFNSRDFFRTPSRYGNLSVTWRPRSIGTLFAGLRYTGSMRAPHYPGSLSERRLEVTPSFVTADASIAFPLVGRQDVPTASSAAMDPPRMLTLTIAVRNLTNAFQQDLDQGPLRDANYVYGPRTPRAVSVGLRAEF